MLKMAPLGRCWLIWFSVLLAFTSYGQNIRVTTLTSTGGTTTTVLRATSHTTLAGGTTNIGPTATHQAAPLLISGSFAFPPVTNANPWVVIVTTNTLQRNIGATNGTVSFSGTAEDGVRIEYHKVNTGNTNYDITIPSSLSVAQALTAVTTVTCNSNSLTKLIWTRVSGAWHLSVEKEDDYSFAMTGVAIGKIPKVTAVEPKIVVGWADDATAAGGASIRVQSNTVVVGTVTNINFMWNASDLALLWTNNGTTGAAEGYFALAAGIERKSAIVTSNYQTRAVYREIWIPAGAMTPAAVNGPSTNSFVGSDGRIIDMFSFDDTTPETNYFSISFPDAWDRGTIKARYYWTASTGTAAQGVTWGLAGAAISDDDVVNTANGTRFTVTDAYIASGDMHVSSATSAITIGGTPALNDMVHFELVRVQDVGDDKTGDANLIGVKIQYRESATDVAIW